MFLFRCCRPAKPSTPVDEDKLAEDPSPRPVLAANKSFETIRANTRSDSRILQTIDSTAGRNNAPSRSLLEASARRLVTQETTDAPELDKDDHGIPNKFMTAYFNALKSGNSRWAVDVPAISNMFADDAQLFTQDKQTLRGKAAVLKQLEKGMEMLIKLGNRGEIPVVEISEATPNKEGVYEQICTIKQGMRSISFQQEYSIAGGKIMLLRNVRK